MLKNIIKINLYRNKVDNNPDIIKLKKKHNLSNSLPRTSHKLNIENFEINQKNLKTESDKIIDENHQFLTSYEMFLKKFPKNYEKKKEEEKNNNNDEDQEKKNINNDEEKKEVNEKKDNKDSEEDEENENVDDKKDANDSM